VLLTRADEATASAAQAQTPGGTYDPVARLGVWKPRARRPGDAVIACAGTADLPVAEEAAATLSALGWPPARLTDVGVAGLHRLLAEEPVLQAADVILVVAGMEGALASAVGGLAAAPIIAVPTSAGYGSSLEGVTALLAMLASCAPGVAVMGIDNGYGAACAAARILGGLEKARTP
jgi:NCAIR mutase (PurE)-related protein